MKTKTISEAILENIFANLEAANPVNPEDKKAEKDPRQDALDELFSSRDAFGCAHKHVRKVTEILTGLKIKPAPHHGYSTRYQIVVATDNIKSNHKHPLGKPLASLSKEGHAYCPGSTTCYHCVAQKDSRPATEQECKEYIAALKANPEGLKQWLSNFSVVTLLD